MKNFLTVLSIMFTALFTACSSNGISVDQEEQGPSCIDIQQQISYEYFYGNNVNERVCKEYRRILSANGISANSSFSHMCMPMCRKY